MKFNPAVTLIVTLLLCTPMARAEEQPLFPRVGAEYFMIYASPRASVQAGGAPTGRLETSLRLKIVLCQPDGWVFARKIEDPPIYSEPTAEKPNREILGWKKGESEPSWFNLKAFSEAMEIKK